MTRLYLFPNALSDERKAASVRCAGRLARCFELTSDPDGAALLGCAAGRPEDAHAVAAFGGDGTMLRAAQIALKAKKPLLGVNTGRLGYLCALSESDLDAFDEAAFRLLQPSPRSVLAFGWQGETRYALNELIIAKGDYGTTLDVAAHLDGRAPDTWQGDGLLVVTPTGSSAYNQSAGGPRLLPGCGCFVMTPLCPTGANRSPIVFSDRQTVTLYAKPRFSPQEARVYADGVFVGALNGEMRVSRSENDLILMIRPPVY